MSADFDPYYRWLAIPPAEQPPHHYRLLGTQLFEKDMEVIRDAAQRQMAHVRSYQSGRYADLSQRVLDELAAARACLLEPAKKREYDRRLREELASARPSEPAPVLAEIVAEPPAPQTPDAPHHGPPPLPTAPPPPMRQVRPGDTIQSRLLGRCELVSLVFQGSSATVFKARAPDGRGVQIKAMAPEFAAHAGCLARFYEEAAVAMRLDHANLLEVFEVGQDDGLHFAVTEHVAGENLRRHIEQHGKMDVDQAVRLVWSMAEALWALHQAGMVHRCVQPANILLTKSGRAKLAEMGLAAYVDEHVEPIHTGLGLECQQYLAPEQIRRETAADARSDVYSLGATLYTLVTGRVPFRAASITELLAAKDAQQYRAAEKVNPELSPAVAAAIGLAMSAERTERPESVAALAKLLRADLQRVGRYRLLEEMGRGTSGTVFRGRSPDGRDVAVKFLAPEAAANERRLARFQREAELAMQVAHPHLVQALEIGNHPRGPFIVLEYVEGGNLAKRVQQSGRLGEPEALRIAIDVAQALDGAHHRGILHRDVNPANILLTRQGRAKLADLGLSKQLDDDLNLTMDGTGLGTPEYIAPEQFTGAKNVDRRCDVYGLGVTLYVMLTGKLPFVGKSNIDKLMAKVNNQYRPPEQFNPDITAMTLDLVKRSIDADANKRPATAGQFAMEALDCLTPARNPQAAPQWASPEHQAEWGTRWHVVLAGDTPPLHRFKATAAHISRQIITGQLGPSARASRSGLEPMAPLSELELFAGAFAQAPVAAPGRRREAGFLARLWSSLRQLLPGT